MINNSSSLPYIKLTNNGPATFAFDVLYTVDGALSYGYSKPILPGNSVPITLYYTATDIKITMYVLNPPYQLIPVTIMHFDYAINRCYLSSGTISTPSILRIPCFTGDNSNNNCCCCCCCK